MSNQGPAGLIYACLCSQDQKILAEAGNKSTLKSTLQAFISGIYTDPRDKAAFNHGPYTYNFLKEGGFTFIAIAPVKVESRVVFSFLREMIHEFNSGSDKSNYTGKLNNLLVKYSNPQRQDLIFQMNEDLEITKRQLHQNLNDIVGRGVALEVLEQTATDLEGNAQGMGERATKVKNVVWWKRLKFRICIGVCCVLFILIIIAVIVIAIVVPKK
jgi:hypothetical protein